MSSYSTEVTTQELVESLKSNHLIESQDEQKVQCFIENRSTEKELPLYLRFLAGVGAGISSLCFIAFLEEAKIIHFSSEGSLITWGLLFVVLAIFIARLGTDMANTIRHSFVMQSSFCLMGVGKLLVIIGTASLFKPHEGWGVTFATFLLSIATYHIYRMSIDRFLSSLGVFTSLLFNILFDSKLESSTQLIFNTFCLVQVGLAAFLFTHVKVKRAYLPIAYASAMSLCFTVLFLSLRSEVLYRSSMEPLGLNFLNGILAVALISLIGWAAGSMKRLKSQPLLIASLGAVFLGCLSSPGIILSLCLMVLGYSKHERLLLLMGMLLLPCFLVQYYYNLDATLLVKSGYLVLSGVILLLGRLYMTTKNLCREVIS